MVKLNVIKQISQAQNGVGAFVMPCKKVTITYCNFGGSSQGMRDFLRLRLKTIAQLHPEVEFRVLQKSGTHPVITGDYTNGNNKQICVRKWNLDIIQNKLDVILNSNGNQCKKPQNSVDSKNESVRGIWSPFYVHPSHRFKI